MIFEKIQAITLNYYALRIYVQIALGCGQGLFATALRSFGQLPCPFFNFGAHY